MRAVVLATVVLAGCAAAPNALPSPAPPHATATPAAPSAETSRAPAAAATATPPADAERTRDDDALDALIRAGADEAIPQLRRLNRMDPSKLWELFVPLGAWIDSQRTSVEALEPSSCTAAAVDLFLDGMDGYDDIRAKFLAWRDWGAHGNAFPPGAPNQAIGMIEDALAELDARCNA
jgi:hypothetical protein